MNNPQNTLETENNGNHGNLQTILNLGDCQEIWIDQGTSVQDVNILITLSNESGEYTVLVTPETVMNTSAKHFVETPPERMITSSERIKARLMKVFALFSYLLAGTLIVFSVLSASGIVKARIVLTNSMAPAINPGDIVLTTSPERIAPELGKVVAYQGRRFDGSRVGVFSHRIIGGDQKSGWIVKGDNNPDPDTQKPRGLDILGVVFFVIPFIGKFLTKQALIIIAPIAVGIWMAVDTFKQGDDEE